MDAPAFALGDISATALLLVGLVAFLSSVLGGLSGTGVGLLMMPLLVPIVGIKGVVPVISVAMLLGSASRLWVFRQHIIWPVSTRILVGAVPGVVLGATIYDWLPAQALYALLGGFLLFSVPARRIFVHSDRMLNAGGRGTLGLGALYGVVSGSLSGGGPILVAILLGMGIKGAAIIGTKSGVSIVLHAVKSLTFGAYGLLDTELVLAAALLGLCTLPGAYTAKWLIEHMQLRLHTLIIEVAVVIGGCSLLWQAFA